MPSVKYLGTGSATMSKMEIYNYASLWTTEITQHAQLYSLPISPRYAPVQSTEIC